jgi:hypothetical protein
MIWRTEKILVSWIKDWKYFWRTRNFKEVYFESDEKLEIWDLVDVKLVKVNWFIIDWEKIV